MAACADHDQAGSAVARERKDPSSRRPLEYLSLSPKTGVVGERQGSSEHAPGAGHLGGQAPLVEGRAEEASRPAPHVDEHNRGFQVDAESNCLSNCRATGGRAVDGGDNGRAFVVLAMMVTRRDPVRNSSGCAHAKPPRVDGCATVGSAASCSGATKTGTWSSVSSAAQRALPNDAATRNANRLPVEPSTPHTILFIPPRFLSAP
jgi:hypothetical protein